MSFVRKLAGDTALYGIPSILGRLLNFIILAPYLTRIVQQDEYGVLSIMYAFAAFMMVFMTYRMETTFFRFGSRNNQMVATYQTGMTVLLLSTAIFVTTMILISDKLATWLLEDGSLGRYFIWFAAILGLDTMVSLPFARLRLENKARRFAIFKSINVVSNALMVVLLIEVFPRLSDGSNLFSFIDGWKGMEIDLVFLANLFASGLVFILFLQSFFNTSFKIHKALFKKMWVYAAPLVVVGLASVINQLADRHLLMQFLDGTVQFKQAQVGIYSAAAKMAIFMTLFTMAFNYAAEPFFFSHSENKGSKKIYAQVGLAFSMVGSLVFLGVMLYIDLIIQLLGKDFHDGLPVIPILLLAYLWLGLYYNFSIWYKLTDKTHIGAYISIGGSIITLGLNLLLIPSIGFYASAWAAFACYLFMAIASFITGKRYFPIPYDIKRMALIIILAISIYCISVWLNSFFGWDLKSKTFVNSGLLILFILSLKMLFPGRLFRAVLKND